ncbi:MAG TPA: polysaccharide biosynthesis C-terminal domain-containing protein, partial [Ignavibacteriaceae bacterium]|nr:polysaccharide biosynthesis C-terminal domain-containing protein [Ignavibacteriaceae bacterium]
DRFSTPYIAVFLSSLLLSSLIVLFKVPINRFLSIPAGYDYLIFFMAAILFLDSISALPFVRLRVERKARKFALFKMINIIINVVLNLVLILKFKLGIEAVFISNLAASIISFIMLVPLLIKTFKLSFDKELFNKLLKFGLPYLPAGLAAMVIQVIDRPILEHLTDLKTLGIYQANYRLGIFMMLFVNMFQYAWQPFIVQESKDENAKKLFAKVLTYFTVAGSIILVLLSLFIDDIVKLRIPIHGKTVSLIGAAYWSGLYIVPVVLLAYLFNGIYAVLTVGIFIEEKSIYAPVIAGAGAVVNVVCNLLLIPPMGIMGAALATLASYVVMAFGFYFAGQKFYKIEYELGKVFKIFFVIGAIGAVYYILLYKGILLLIYKAILLILFAAFLYFFIFDKNEIIFLKKNFRQYFLRK